MRFKAVLLFATLLLIVSATEAKKKRKSSSYSPSTKSKTKTKWSTSSEVGPNNADAVIATEEHGYYIKRTYLPPNSTLKGSMTPQSPPYLGIPIAWLPCEGDKCMQGNSGAINGNSNAVSDGFLCDDDCSEPYQPICGKSPHEVAVFYNKCKLNVAKCRTHGLWQDLSYEECKKLYSSEVEYTEKKFKSSPFFKDATIVEEPEQPTVPILEENKHPTEVKLDKQQIIKEKPFNEVTDKVVKSNASTTKSLN